MKWGIEWKYSWLGGLISDQSANSRTGCGWRLYFALSEQISYRFRRSLLFLLNYPDLPKLCYRNHRIRNNQCSVSCKIGEKFWIVREKRVFLQNVADNMDMVFGCVSGRFDIDPWQWFGEHATHGLARLGKIQV